MVSRSCCYTSIEHMKIQTLWARTMTAALRPLEAAQPRETASQLGAEQVIKIKRPLKVVIGALPPRHQLPLLEMTATLSRYQLLLLSAAWAVPSQLRSLLPLVAGVLLLPKCQLKKASRLGLLQPTGESSRPIPSCLGFAVGFFRRSFYTFFLARNLHIRLLANKRIACKVREMSSEQ